MVEVREGLLAVHDNPPAHPSGVGLILTMSRVLG